MIKRLRGLLLGVFFLINFSVFSGDAINIAITNHPFINAISIEENIITMKTFGKWYNYQWEPQNFKNFVSSVRRDEETHDKIDHTFVGTKKDHIHYKFFELNESVLKVMLNEMHFNEEQIEEILLKYKNHAN
jgi:hypothetical protein